MHSLDKSIMIPAMRKVLITISIIGLILTIVPAILVFLQEIALQTCKHLMLAGMIMWFSTAFFWMKEQKL